MSERTVLDGDEEQKAPVKTGDHLFFVLDGANVARGGLRVDLGGLDEVELGRGAKRLLARKGRTARFDLEDSRVSSTHARLVRAGRSWTLTDLGSSNGTWLDGHRVESTPLDRDTPFVVGSAVFMIEEAKVAEPLVESAELPGLRQGMASLSPAYAEALGKLARIAASDLSVMLLGPSGTGKEVLAQAIHVLSGRKGPFVGVNCGALSATLMEAQLFGHTKGAFSGAIKDEPGFIRAADNGTLFLDEIGDMPPASQAALLRVLETREVVPVGSTQTVKVNIRVVCATLKPRDTLREDLRARLSGYVHRLPALRDRLADFGLIASALLPRALASDPAAQVRIAPEAVRAMAAYPWPLNVRELLQVLSSSVVLARDAQGVAQIKLEHLPEALRGEEVDDATPAKLPQAAPRPAKPPVPADERKTALLAQLAETGGNVSEVARRMDTTRMQVHRWIDKFEIDLDGYRPPKDGA